MNSAKKLFIPAILIMVFCAMSSFGEAVQKRIEFDVNGPFSMRMENYSLPAGHYVLYQLFPNDLNLFALYENDMTHPPIALVTTTRIMYPTDNLPGHSRMLVRYSEVGDQAEPVVTGWTIPGDDGWQIIAVVPKNESVLTKVR